MAELAFTVDTDGVSGDYASLQAAISAQITANGDLDGDGNNLTITCQSTDSSDDTTAASINGFTTSSGNEVTITGASGQRAKKDGWDASIYLLDVAATAIESNDNYITIDGLQITSNSGGFCIYQNSGTPMVVTNCRLSGGTTNFRESESGGSPTTTILNTISENSAGTSDNYIFYYSTALVYNCICYNAGRDGIEEESNADVTVRNCAAFANSDDFDFAGSGDINYCASDDGDNTGNDIAESGGGANWPDDFVDAANGDFTLKATSNLVGAGLDLSGTFTTDIDGETRVAWDVGPDEYIVAGPSGTDAVPLLMHMARLRGS